MTNERKSIVIIGAGTGGLSVASRLKRLDHNLQITIIEPQTMHYYQPLWTLVGAGIAKKEVTEKPLRPLIPKFVDFIQDSVNTIDPDKKELFLTSGRQVSYDYLIVAPGLKLNWNKITGLNENLGKNGICSIYQYDQVDEVTHQIQSFQGGTAIFIMPPVPIKCAGAPQKIMYLAEDIWRKKGIRDRCEIIFACAGPSMFGIPTFAEPLSQIVKERGIKTKFLHTLQSIDPENKTASFTVGGPNDEKSIETLKYDMIHVVPTMSAPDFIASSKLAAAEGPHKNWLEVDKYTLQHVNYKEVFGIGDVTGIPNSKTGAAIRKQYPVVASNLLATIEGRPLPGRYDGYSSCPLVTEVGKVMLAEFGYEGKLMPSFPLDPAIPRKIYWHLKKDMLPIMYWHGMMKGLV